MGAKNVSLFIAPPVIFTIISFSLFKDLRCYI